METIAVFGASGRTGQQVILAALARGYAVRAICRPTSTMSILHSNLLRMNGSLLDPLFVRQAIQGVSAVVIALGPHMSRKEVFLASATRAIVQAMQHKDVKRLICVTGTLIGEFPRRRSWFVRWMQTRFRKSRPQMYRDREEQEALIQQTDLAWTIVKPPRLTTGNRTGRYQTGLDLEVSAFSKLSRADLADFIVSQLFSIKHTRQMPVVLG